MVSLEKAVLARFEKSGKRFEIYVEPFLAMDVKKGAEVPLRELLAVETVFRDAKKGEKAKEEDIEKIFGTKDIEKIAKRIIKEGELQLTTEMRKKAIEDLKKKIVYAISKRGINPQTKTPHPPSRIEKAIEQVGFHVNLFKPFEEQVKEAVKSIAIILPIRFEKTKIYVKIPSKYAGRAYGEVAKISDILRDEWKKDGTWAAHIVLPSGTLESFIQKMNEITHGDVEIKIEGREKEG